MLLQLPEYITRLYELVKLIRLSHKNKRACKKQM